LDTSLRHLTSRLRLMSHHRMIPSPPTNLRPRTSHLQMSLKPRTNPKHLHMPLLRTIHPRRTHLPHRTSLRLVHPATNPPHRATNHTSRKPIQKAATNKSKNSQRRRTSWTTRTMTKSFVVPPLSRSQPTTRQQTKPSAKPLKKTQSGMRRVAQVETRKAGSAAGSARKTPMPNPDPSEPNSASRVRSTTTLISRNGSTRREALKLLLPLLLHLHRPEDHQVEVPAVLLRLQLAHPRLALHLAL
jgi:hypothetical protein